MAGEGERDAGGGRTQQKYKVEESQVKRNPSSTDQQYHSTQRIRTEMSPLKKTSRMTEMMSLSPQWVTHSENCNLTAG